MIHLIKQISGMYCTIVNDLNCAVLGKQPYLDPAEFLTFSNYVERRKS